MATVQGVLSPLVIRVRNVGVCFERILGAEASDPWGCRSSLAPDSPHSTQCYQQALGLRRALWQA